MFTLLTAADWPIVGQLAWLLGKVMNFIYNILDNMLATDEGLVGLSIIIYTIFVYTLLLPMTIKQQKTTRITAIMNPELQAIQKKYANKKDQASQLKMQEEMQRVYDKYGTSMTGGCVQILIQMPLLFALYPVIYDMGRYVPAIKNATGDVQKFLTIPDLSMSPSQIMKVKDTFDIAPIIIVITCIALPAISALTQYISLKLSQKITDANNKKNGNGRKNDANDMAAQTMKSMNITMPLFSLWMVYTLSAGIGVYWIVSAVVRCIQQIIINKYLDRISVEELIEKNKEKAEKKRAKREVRAEKMNEMAQMNAKNIESTNSKKISTISDKERAEKLKKAEASRNNAKAGSLASKANMVKKYNENK